MSVFVLLGVVQAPAQTQAPAPSLDACRAEIDTNPRNPVAYYCVYRFVLAHGHPEDASALLREYFSNNPGVFRIEMFIAWIDRMSGRTGWERMLAEAVDGMERTGDAYGVVYGGLMLASRLGEQGELRRAQALLSRCERAAERTGNPAMRGRVLVGRGLFGARRGDYSGWLHLIRQAEKEVFPDGPYDIRSIVLSQLGAAYWYLCRYREAYGAFARAAGIREAAHDLWWQGIDVYNMSLCGFSLVNQGEMTGAELGKLLDRGHRLAVRSGNMEVEAGMELLLGRHGHGAAARRHARLALKLARQSGNVGTEIEALELLASSLANGGSPRLGRQARRYFLQARQRARETGQHFLLAEVRASEARVAALCGSREEGVRAHSEVLDLIERLRAPQVGGTVRAQSFSRWDFVYYRLAGLLLQGSPTSPDPRRDRALAFRTMERFRARELLESLQAPQPVPAAGPGDGLAARHEEVSARISRLQRNLADPGLPADRRREGLRRLTELEEEECALRDRMTRRSRPRPASSQQGIPTVAEIQALLRSGEAMLSYQLWDGEPAEWSSLPIGKSWLLVITRGGVRSIALPARRDLRAQVEVMEGLLRSGGREEAASLRATSRLGRDLLGEALAGFPEGIHRLVIVPDDVLCRCPFAALVPGRTGTPLGSRHAISLVPSAAVWAHLRRQRLAAPRSDRTAALILYAPATGGRREGEGAFRDAGPWREGLSLAPLPHAAGEARALERAAGPGTLVLSDSEASEAALKSMSLGRFGILDLVTHAVVDEEQPERSAIILAPGSETEDGFLQVREIPELNLDGQLVILSSCSSSSGRILGGEGAQSLARAFLEGGAGAVLASLWPLEDEQAASLFGDLSKELGRGRRVSDALRRAQGQAVDRGMSVEAWAGVVVLGDGDLAPLPAGGLPGAWSLLTAMIVLMLLGALLIRRIR